MRTEGSICLVKISPTQPHVTEQTSWWESPCSAGQDHLSLLERGKRQYVLLPLQICLHCWVEQLYGDRGHSYQNLQRNWDYIIELLALGQRTTTCTRLQLLWVFEAQVMSRRMGAEQGACALSATCPSVCALHPSPPSHTHTVTACPFGSYSPLYLFST